jgi:hypothetical protein
MMIPEKMPLPEMLVNYQERVGGAAEEEIKLCPNENKIPAASQLVFRVGLAQDALFITPLCRKVKQSRKPLLPMQRFYFIRCGTSTSRRISNHRHRRS